MNRLRWIGILIVLWVLGVVVHVLFFVESVEPGEAMYKEIIEEELLQNSQKQLENTINEGAVEEVPTQDPVALYHQQVRNHVAWSRFEWVYAQYRETKDIKLLAGLIDAWLEWWEYEVLRKELSEIPLNETETAQIIWAQRILKTLFTITPLTFKSYEVLKDVVDNYESLALITIQEKNFWYSLVAISKWNIEDYKYYATRTADPQRISLIESVQSNQNAYEYVPKRRWLGLYGIAFYEAWRYRVSQNIATLLQKEDPTYVLWYQLWSWSNLQLHQWNRAETAAQKALQYDTTQISNNQYALIEAIAVYNQWDYARSMLLFSQLENTEYKQYALRYIFKIAKKTSQWLTESLKKLSTIEMTPSDYYEVVDILYSPVVRVSQDIIQEVERIVQKCQSSIPSSYSYICIMWKAWILWEQWEVGKTRIILEQITKQYPTWQARELLGNAYTVWWENKLAKQAFIQALRFAQDQQDQERLLSFIES